MDAYPQKYNKYLRKVSKIEREKIIAVLNTYKDTNHCSRDNLELTILDEMSVNKLHEALASSIDRKHITKWSDTMQNDDEPIVYDDEHRKHLEELIKNQDKVFDIIRLKLEDPSITVREMSRKLGLCKQTITTRTHMIATALPAFGVAIGINNKWAISQRNRRMNEGNLRVGKKQVVVKTTNTPPKLPSRTIFDA